MPQRGSKNQNTRNGGRAKFFEEGKPRQQRSGNREAFTGKAESADPLSAYERGPLSGLIPVIEYYGQNFDFSTFPLLCECTYQDMQVIDHRLARKMPFCIFLHHCTVALNANLIGAQLGSRDEVRSYLKDMVIPGSIAEYISAVGETVTLSGLKVSFNLPEVARPKLPTEIPGEAGTFGEVTAETHNVYECYVAPRVTRNRIEASIKGDRNWTPLNPALLPVGASATVNFLGYGSIDSLRPEETIALSGLSFPDDDKWNGIASRLQYNSNLVALVNSTLRSLSGKYKIVSAIVERKIRPGYVGFLEVTSEFPSDLSIAEASCCAWSPNAGGNELSNATYFLGMKRKRNTQAPGYCMLIDGAPITEWEATMNYNFECVAPFNSVLRPDNPELRVARHIGGPTSGSRSIDLHRFVELNFRK